ncbi:MAG: septum formation protein [Bacteroidia bacterium]|jgi:septum formation protein
MNKIILASNSPRRKELMQQLGFGFEVKSEDFDEVIKMDLDVKEVSKYLAEQKNDQYRELFSNEIIVTADTVVIIAGQILGKPSNAEEAKQMLSQLSNGTHSVMTGVCISSNDKKISFDDSTNVSFKNLEANEIDFYINKFKPYDKAGAYGIQEWIGMIGIEAIEGSYYNVMGLPVHKVYDCFKDEFAITPC